MTVLWLRSLILFILTKQRQYQFQNAYLFMQGPQINNTLNIVFITIKFNILCKNYPYFNQMKIGIIGSGISGLGLALRICQATRNAPQTMVTIFQANSHCGGRIHTKIVQAGSKQKIFLDMGANLIDFQNEQSEKEWHKILPARMAGNLKLLDRPFLIHENNQFRKGDYHKNRYYYKGGFIGLVHDLVSTLDEKRVNIKYGHEVVSIKTNLPHLQLAVKNKQKSQVTFQTYDKVYISCPAPQTVSILQEAAQQCDEAENIVKYCKQIEYTKQLSVAFSTKKGVEHQFSCVLFKNHPVLTFVCSHQQKYNQNTYVAQISEDFSEKYFQEEEDSIVKKVYESLPVRIKQITDPQHLLLWRWPISLIKPRKNLAELIPGKYLNLVGDSVLGRSRVSNALQSTSLISSSL